MSIHHLVPDIIAPNLDIVFCGTALGFESERQRAYYAHPGNKFWPSLHKFGFTPHKVEPKDYAEILQWGIGLTDMCKTHHGNDEDILTEHYDTKRLRRQIEKFQPRYLAFTSKKAAQMFLQKRDTSGFAYGLLNEYVGKTQLYVLPSPSGHATRYWTDEPWLELKMLSDAHRHQDIEG